MTNALDVVSHQHAELQTLAAPIGIALDRGEPVDERAVSQLVAAVSAHDAIERGYVFPLVAARLGREHLLSAIEAHGRQSRILAEIERRPDGDPHRQALLGHIVEAVHIHVHDEQTVVSLLRARVAAEELERIGESMEAARPRAPTRPHPHLGGSGGGARLSARLFARVDHLRDRLRRRPRPPQQAPARREPRRVELLRVLGSDHREMTRLLEDLTVVCVDELGRKQLTNYVAAFMAHHETSEALVLWPTVRRRVPGGHALAREALQQEREGRFFLDTLLAAHDERACQELAAGLLGAARAHMTFEEDEVWPRLQRATTALSRMVTGTKYRVAFRFGPTRPNPDGPDQPTGLHTVVKAGAMSDWMRDKRTGRL